MNDKLLAIAVFAVFLLSVALWYVRDQRDDVQRQLNQANQTIELMRQTQQASDEALAKYQKLKEEADAELKRQHNIMEQALSGAGSWSSSPLPQSVRELYEKGGADGDVHSTGGTGAADTTAADGQHQD